VAQEFRLPIEECPFHGDMSTSYGKVTRKYEQGGEHLVDISLFSETQDGLQYACSEATVRLLKRG
jgi:hypothetical protein